MRTTEIISAARRVLGNGVVGGMRVHTVSRRYGVHFAMLTVTRSQRTFRGNLTDVEIVAGGLGLSIASARARCAMEMAERLVATSPAVALNALEDRRAGKPLPWSRFAPYPVELRTSIARRRKLRLRCIASGVISGKLYSVPAEAVLLDIGRHTEVAVPGEYDASGLAAGIRGDRAATYRRATCEVLERDAIMLSWRVDGWPCMRLSENLPSPRVLDALKSRGLSLRLFEVGDPGLHPVVLAVVSRRDGTHATCGSAASASLADSATKATLEAIMAYYVAKARQHPVTSISTSADHIVYAHRAGSQVVEWYERQASVAPRRAPKPPRSFSELALRCRERFGCEPLVTHLSTVADLDVIRVLVPGVMRKEWQDKLRFTAAQRRGVDAEVRQNLTPHPFG